eukprot:TRINITY_DN77505_c0_g1_i1.p1 TRINITY_DN77505_c0_g1~~TRINITY_DN77505_c0_g1_i1.p1  ORF type:complete len:116 (+),score=19.46 TRINITY_DN77505_c0_g1_i1:77-424(+)
MTNVNESSSLPGHKDCGTIVMKFNFPGNSDASTGATYPATEILGFLPNNADGKKALDLFEKAFERKQLFRINEEGQVSDNGFSIKTQKSGGLHGYPDASYLERVIQEFQSRDIVL